MKRLNHRRDDYASGGSFEHNDCVVRAFATAACVSYEAAHELFKRHGRKDRHKTYPLTTKAVMAEAFPGLEPRLHPCGTTLARFVEENHTGHYIVHVSGHALAVVDGVVHDWNERPRRIVKKSWKLV